MKVDHFVLQRQKRLWHWELWGSHHPRPIAQCGRGYKTEKSARNSMQSAYNAMVGARGEDGQLRIDRRSSAASN